MDNDQELKITVLDAMQWLKVAWDEMTPTPIQNCFHHCTLSISTPEVDMTTHIGTDNILDELRQCGVDVEGSFEDFANVDKKFATTAILTDEDIAAMFLGDAAEEESSAEDNDEPVACLTLSEYCSPLDVVRHFVTCRSTDNQYLNVISSLDELLYSVSFNRQTTITESFQS